MAASNIRLIRIDGIVPQNKAAIREALDCAPENIMLLLHSPGEVNVADRIFSLDKLNPGDSIAFTDGAGKYYGKITRCMADQRTVGGSKPAYVMDANPK